MHSLILQEELLSHEQLLQLVLAQLLVVLLPHLLLSGANLWYCLILDQHFVILTLFEQSLILNFPMAMLIASLSCVGVAAGFLIRDVVLNGVTAGVQQIWFIVIYERLN